ncbi:hypothetical protein BHW_0900077 [Borrelia hermsii MTW]|nr:hypothetical protein BHW_0900077 [Borrelia hermsii MTW]
MKNKNTKADIAVEDSIINNGNTLTSPKNHI